MTDLRTLDAVATAAGIATGELDPQEVVRSAVERTREVDERLGGVAAPLYAAARSRAADAVPHGPLGGVPTAVKEIVGIAGAPFTNGSRSWHGNRSTRTWTAARQHLATGLVALATTTMSEFGLAPTTEPLGRAPTRNPWDPDHTPGGSSGGSAVLVAAGAVPIAFATDGAGSIRVPASCCGVVGLKPSRGRMTSLGEVERTPVPLAVHGVVARTVRDVAAYHAAAERVVPPAADLPPIGHVRGPDGQRARVGVVTEPPAGVAIDRDVVRAVEDAAAVLDDRGHRVEPMSAPSLGRFTGDVFDYFAVLAVLLAAVSRREVGAGYDEALRDPWTRSLATMGRRALPRLPAIVRRLRRAAAVDRELYGGHDVVLSPVTTTPAPRLGHLAPTVPVDVLRARIGEWLAFTPVHNIAGSPAMSVPSTPASTGLPVGVQLAGLPGDEAQLLALAYELEEEAPWPLLAPRSQPAAGPKPPLG